MEKKGTEKQKKCLKEQKASPVQKETTVQFISRRFSLLLSLFLNGCGIRLATCWQTSYWYVKTGWHLGGRRFLQIQQNWKKMAATVNFFSFEDKCVGDGALWWGNRRQLSTLNSNQFFSWFLRILQWCVSFYIVETKKRFQSCLNCAGFSKQFRSNCAGTMHCTTMPRCDVFELVVMTACREYICTDRKRFVSFCLNCHHWCLVQVTAIRRLYHKKQCLLCKEQTPSISYRRVPFNPNTLYPKSWKSHGAGAPNLLVLNLTLNSKFAWIKRLYLVCLFGWSGTHLYSTRRQTLILRVWEKKSKGCVSQVLLTRKCPFCWGFSCCLPKESASVFGRGTCSSGLSWIGNAFTRNFISRGFTKPWRDCSVHACSDNETWFHTCMRHTVIDRLLLQTEQVLLEKNVKVLPSFRQIEGVATGPAVMKVFFCRSRVIFGNVHINHCAIFEPPH